MSYECGGCGKRVKKLPKYTESSPRGFCNCSSQLKPNWLPVETTNKETGMPQSVPTEIKSNDRAFDTGWAVVKEQSYPCGVCNAQMSIARLPQICDNCLKGLSGGPSAFSLGQSSVVK